PTLPIASRPVQKRTTQPPTPPAEANSPAVPSAPAEQSAPTPDAAPGEPVQDANRSSIEQWMADLRSSRRRSPGADPDEGKHHDSGNRTVSVNELLRRQNRD
ncbi:hypothetical protein, partial [Nocardia alni]|uniref:hypothetical protein n=1 Tax=Nocardia alni TaxID=2815723 RepID=UPI001C226FB0